MDRYATLRHGLVGAWLASASAGGPIARDFSPYNRNGTLSASSWIGSVGGWALSLNGSTSNVAIADAYWLKPPSTITVSAWAIATAQTGYVVFKKNSRAATFLEAFSVYADTNVWGVNVSSSEGTQSNLTTPKTLNQWTHICLTFARPTLSLFLNGQLISTRSHNFNLDHSDTDLVIGRSNQSAFQFPFTGYVNDVRVYGRALTASEVKILATSRGIGLQPTRHRRTLLPSTKQMSVRVNGAWVNATPYVNVNGEWQQATPFARVDGVWK